MTAFTVSTQQGQTLTTESVGAIADTVRDWLRTAGHTNWFATQQANNLRELLACGNVREAGFLCGSNDITFAWSATTHREVEL